MVDEALSRAVIDYVWGVPRRAWPTCLPSSLSDGQRRLLPRVLAVVSSADTVPPTWSDLTEGYALAEEAVRTRHPELSDDAVAAIANSYCYAWR